MYTGKKYFEEGLITLIDTICIIFSMMIAAALRYEGIFASRNVAFAAVISLVSYLAVRAIFPSDSSLSIRGYYEEALRVLRIHVLFFAVTVAFLYVSYQGAEISRLMLGYFYCIDMVLMYLSRLVLKMYLFKHYRMGNRSRRLLVFTDSEQVKDVIFSLRVNSSWDYRIVGVVVYDLDMTGAEIQGVPVVCSRDGLIDYVRTNPVDEIFIRIDKKFPISMKKMVLQLESMGIVVDVSIQIYDMNISVEKTLNQIGIYRVVTFGRKILTYQEQALKRGLDILGGLVGMVILCVATIFVWPAIKLESPGPVFFKQTRVGKNGRYFQLYKFRSMYQDAEERKKELMEKNEMNGLMFKIQDDPRVTKVGKFIRKTSIDELPQFWNVLKGDMSLVGTRPPTVDEYQQYKPEYKTRLSLMPGLTGLWQVSGRSKVTDFEEVLEMDVRYIDSWSLKNDIKIILQTIMVVLFGKGAV